MIIDMAKGLNFQCFVHGCLKGDIYGESSLSYFQVFDFYYLVNQCPEMKNVEFWMQSFSFYLLLKLDHFFFWKIDFFAQDITEI